ncbi:RAD52 motif-containing protein 1-like [Delphinapterus leucas]|uniref:RAD52 motif-containing protein 1-like n=1 Tax=Delphinapterus leucas TaxID=9749 RepID=A0A7F8K6C9_DELLE|nr:RAD52 motif-containing protein 1-like [Delphinapterus leucas]
MVQLVPFAVPIEGDKTLLVWELSSGPTPEALQLSRAGGEGRVEEDTPCPSNWAPRAVGSPGFSAIIKFYSARDAHRAQKACDQKQLFHTSPVKLQDLSNLEERENEDIVTPLQKQSLKVFCALEVVLPSHECRSPGVGMAEEPLDKLEESLFSKSGKTAVAYRPCEEVTDARTEEELQDLIQNELLTCPNSSFRSSGVIPDSVVTPVNRVVYE